MSENHLPVTPGGTLTKEKAGLTGQPEDPTCVKRHRKDLFMVKYYATVVLLAVLTLNTQAQTDTESNSIETRIVELEQKLKQLQDELAQQKQAATPSVSTAPAADEQAIAAAVSKAFEKHQAEQPKLPEWINKVSLYGDFRYRYEWTDDESKIADRNRNLIQARIGIKGTINEEFDFNFRLASGGNNSPTSNNQALDDSFSSKNLWIDQAYVDYHPASIKDVKVFAGKIANPYYTVGNSDLLLDSDVTPEGIAAVYKTKLSDTLDLFGTAGGFYVDERQLDADTSLWAVQGGSTWHFGEEKKSHLTAGAGYYDYGNTIGRAGLGSDATQFYGNTSTGGLYDSDFNLVQGFAEVGTPLGGLPLRVFGDVIKNTAAESNEDTAWLAGVSLGKTAAPGTWSFAYNYRDVEADALLGVLAEATFGGGGTNVKGHKFSTNYQLAKNTQVGLTYYDAERTRGGITTDHDVIFADFTIKF